MKPFYTSKTIWVFGLTLLGSILAYVLSPDFPFQLTPEMVAGITAAMSVGAIILRAISSDGIYFKKPEGDQ